MNRHNFSGCSPDPLANYLKSLGILRLISEQLDAEARGWWEGRQFFVMTSASREEVESFFLEDYQPTPFVAPWNKGSGFYDANDRVLNAILASTAPRFERLREGIRAAKSLLDNITKADSSIRAIKSCTKTNKAFQSENQRVLLARDPIYIGMIESLRADLSKPKPDGMPGDLHSIQTDLATLERLSVSRPAPTPDEAKRLKASPGYKRLLSQAEKRYKSLKPYLILECRRKWRGSHAEWLAAAVVLNEEGKESFPSLFGSGGNDGRLDFTFNYLCQIRELFTLAEDTNPARAKRKASVSGNASEQPVIQGQPKATARSLLQNALWLCPANTLGSLPIGQYQPGAAGGANSSTGFASGNLVNPWNLVLMMEGAPLFAASATRRLDPSASRASMASAPFAVRSQAAGHATPGDEESVRGEQWMPLWSQPATLQEVRLLFAESRLQIDRIPATTPVDIARSLGRRGAARGITSFVRYGYLERNGQSNLAVPLSTVQVRDQPLIQNYLIDDLAPWLSTLRRKAREKKASSSLVHLERRLSDVVLDALTHDIDSSRWQSILRAAVSIEMLQASGTAFEAGPIPQLQIEWLEATDDQSAEFRLACALGSSAAVQCRHGGKLQRIDPVRFHALPLEPGQRKYKVAQKRLIREPRVVMLGDNPLRDVSALAERRLVESGMRNERRSRLQAAPGFEASLADIAAFLSGSLDTSKIVDLARAFMAIRWTAIKKTAWQLPNKDRPEPGWLAIRLVSLPFPLDDNTDIPVDPRLMRLLLAGNPSRAVELALARLKAAGIRPPLQGIMVNPAVAQHWAAALAFPIRRQAARQIASYLDPSWKGATRA